jgi:hypothetical protein
MSNCSCRGGNQEHGFKIADQGPTHRSSGRAILQQSFNAGIDGAPVLGGNVNEH